jgi:hypothetical protein
MQSECPCSPTEIELIRSTVGEKGQDVAGYQALRNTPEGLGYLQKTARDRANVFGALMEAVKSYSLGEASHALYDVGGEYRRNMRTKGPRKHDLSRLGVGMARYIFLSSLGGRLWQSRQST